MRYWYQPSLHPSLFILVPFAFLFRGIVGLRRYLYQTDRLKSKKMSVPVIVVGNITVGGTGKTPFVIWLAKFLQSKGYRPGIVSRGVGGKKHDEPHSVSLADPAEIVGDEALVLLNNTNCPVILCVDRVAAAEKILADSNCNIIISDDGLQHYRLQRDIEIAIIDGNRRLGNQYFLPAGPLREEPNRLAEVDFVVVNGGNAQDEFSMLLQPNELVSVMHPVKRILITHLSSKRVHAIAGIGYPQRFFNMLTQLGFDVVPHEFPDHYLYRAADIQFDDSLPVLMTEKDAVKCQPFAAAKHWYVPVTAQLSPELEINLIRAIRNTNKS